MRLRLDLFPKWAGLFLIMGLALSGCTPAGISNSQWQQYKSHFITSEGRVIDTGNGNISHSEGQGIGMLLAASMDDRPAFDNLWQWTRSNLQVRGDHLFRWRRRPGVATQREDPNNATDGDILIAWALLEGFRRWSSPSLKQEALLILGDIKRRLIRRWRQQPVLLPGERGFEHDGGLTINLSYWIFPALKRFAREDPDPIWRQLTESGLKLLAQARFGRWQLPPDWLELKDQPALSSRHDPVFGYNAIRIPLYLAWAGYLEPGRFGPYLAFWKHTDDFMPAWTNLDNNCIDSYDAPPGFKAVHALIRVQVKKQWWRRLPSVSDDNNYYSASLTLLSKLALLQGQT